MASLSDCDDCEVEVGGDENASNIWRDCEKNPNHESFIPVEDFNNSHLGQRWQNHKGIVEFIKLQFFLTVKVSGRRMGTGYICGIKESTEIPCPCSECTTQPQLSKPWLVNIRTCEHVMRYESNIKKVTACLFYDNDTKNGIEKLKGVKHVHQEHGSDYFEFQCITHKMELARKIKEKLESFPLLRGSINQEGGPETIVIVSHPHGYSKKVTVGRASEWRLGESCFQAEYDACTCKGSSGAAVWRIGRTGSSPPWPYHGIHHCQGSKKNPNPKINVANWWPV